MCRGQNISSTGDVQGDVDKAHGDHNDLPLLQDALLRVNLVQRLVRGDGSVGGHRFESVRCPEFR
jgi:hypothetical protein